MNKNLQAALETYSDDDARWLAVSQRDKKADEHFFYAVRTTGVYCRPSCPSRLPLRKNVRFFITSAEAERAGYRRCQKCHQSSEIIAAACKMITESPEPLSLQVLAARFNLSHYHFHRLFKKVTGVTPHAYSTTIRSARFRSHLNQATSVTEAMYRAGYNAVSRLYEKSDGFLGMTPRTYRQGGVGETISFAVAACSLGAILVAATDKGICSIEISDNPEQLVHQLQDNFPHAELQGGDEKFELWVAEVIGAIEAPQHNLNLPLDIRGTAFQQRVWQALRKIPLGQTATYSDIAAYIGDPKAVRAVARACASNKIAIAIPCHRVIRMDSSLSGYRWGVERKLKLLQREKALPA